MQMLNNAVLAFSARKAKTRFPLCSIFQLLRQLKKWPGIPPGGKR
jgi:hypothetical protein